MHVIDATNPEDGNWMRYVNCARYFEEQNIVSIQKGQDVFYKVIKVFREFLNTKVFRGFLNTKHAE